MWWLMSNLDELLDMPKLTDNPYCDPLLDHFADYVGPSWEMECIYRTFHTTLYKDLHCGYDNFLDMSLHCKEFNDETKMSIRLKAAGRDINAFRSRMEQHRAQVIDMELAAWMIVDHYDRLLALFNECWSDAIARRGFIDSMKGGDES